MPKTLYDKIWDSHVIVPETDAPAIIFIDLHLIHEVTSPQAFDELRKRGLRVRRADLTVGTADHSIPTTTRVLSPTEDREAYDQVTKLDNQLPGIWCSALRSRQPQSRASSTSSVLNLE